MTGGAARGTQTFDRYGWRKLFGITPTIVYGRPSSVIDVPKTSGRELSASRQKSSLIIATAGPSGRSSSCMKVRPSAGGKPRTPKKFALSQAAHTVCRGTPLDQPTVTYTP